MSGESDRAKSALVIVFKNLIRDPRVRRQIDWLISEGWVVDTLAMGQRPDVPLRDHFAMTALPRGFRSLIGLALIHLLPYRWRFRVLATNRFPQEVKRRVRDNEYDLLLFNDTHLLGWLGDKETFPDNRVKAHIHIDLHEWFMPSMRPETRGRILMNGYYRWTRQFIGHPLVTSRSVAAGMGQKYAEEFGIPRPEMVRNCPPFVDQSPSAVAPDRIELVHHGVATWRRGIKEMIDAMRLVDDRFTLTFMLVGEERILDEVRDYARDIPDRVRFAPPVPMTELGQEINKYDAEIVFNPPRTENSLFALPNKFFEAIQGRLATIIGPSPSMVEIVEESGNGVVASDWSAEALARAINSLTPAKVKSMKEASHQIAPLHSAETEKGSFFDSFERSDFRPAQG